MARLFAIFLLVTIGLGVSAPAKGQDAAQETVGFFNGTVEKNPVVQIQTTSKDREALSFRYALDDALHLGEKEALLNAIGQVDADFKTRHPQLIELAEIFTDAVAQGQLDRSGLMDALYEFDASDDWYAGVYANTALSVLHIRKLELLLASQSAQTALDLIPDQVSPLVTDAQLLLAEQLTKPYIS